MGVTDYFGDGEKKLEEGALVEVRMMEMGLRGSWHPAVVTAVKPGKRVVEYDELVSDADSGQKLTETIPVGRGVDGLLRPGSSSRQFGKSSSSSNSRKQQQRIFLRPRPPLLSSVGKASWSKGLWVDAFWRDAWWEGILAEDIVSDRAGAQAMVYFPDEGGLEMCLIKDLRLRQEWDEDTGNWSFKGRTKLLPELQQQQQQDHHPWSSAFNEQSKSENFDCKLLPFFNGFTKEEDMVISTKKKMVLGEKQCSRNGVQLAAVAQKLKRKQTSPEGRMAPTVEDSPASSPTYCISNLLKGLSESAREEIVAIVAGDSLPKEQDGNCQMTFLQAAAAAAAAAAAEGTIETTSKVITTGWGEEPTMPFCNGKSNHEEEGEEEEEEEEEEDPSLVPDSAIEEENPGALKSDGVLEKVGKKTPAIEEEQAQCLEDMAIAISVKSLEQCQVLDPENRRLEETLEAATQSVKGMMMMMSMPQTCFEQDESIWKSEQACSMHAKAKEEEEKEEEEEEEAAADDETLEMVLIEHRAQIRKLRVMNGKSEMTPQELGMRSESIRNAMLLRNRQCKRLVKQESGLHAGFSLIESRRGSTRIFSMTGGEKKSCRKRAFNNHHSNCFNLEITERRSKRNRWRSAYEESTMLPSHLPSYKEPCVGNLGVCQVSPIHERRCKKKKGVRGGCHMEVLLSQPDEDQCHPVSGSDLGKNNFYTRKNTLSWLIDAGLLQKDQKLHYMHRRKELGVGGRVTTEGVLCGCCNNVVTLSTFEIHCGSRLHRPCASIFVEDGRSIAALQMEALKKQMSSVGTSSFHRQNHNSRRGNSQIVKEIASDVNDDTCGVCGDGGMLICCDHCPSTFHLKCMELTVVPEEDWYCPNCRCAICGHNQFNGSHDTFHEMSVLFCDQCEREFHVKCLYMRGMPKMEQYPQDSWFCGSSCERIYRGLRGLVGTNNSLGKGFSWTLLRSQDEDPPDPKLMEVDKELLAEQNIKLSIALSVMQECFRPMIDPRTKVDVIAHALYNRGSDVNRLNYHGFYTVILEKGDELISVAAIRVHGAVLAEMPLIGTRFQYRRQGMCRRLMHAIERMLQTLGVETLVLPAVPELLETWIGAFGFQPMDTFPKQSLIELNLMAFPGTSLLHKSLARLQPVADKKTKMCGFKESRQLASLKGGLSRGARVTQRSTLSAHVGVPQFVTTGKVSDEVQEIENPETFPIQSDTIVESSSVGDEHDRQVAQSSTVNFDSPQIAEAVTMRELVDSLMDEHVQRVLEQVIDSDKEFSGKRGSDVLETCPQCNKEDDGSEVELVQHHQHSGFQEHRHPEKESTVQKQDDAYKTKVVVATTRYNRQVKTSQWIADAMKKLRGHSSMRTQCASPLQTHLCNTRLCKPILPSVSEDKHPPIAAGEANLPVNLPCTVESSKMMLQAETDVSKPHAASLSEPESFNPFWLRPSV